MVQKLKIIEHGPMTRIVLPDSTNIYDRSSVTLAVKNALTAWDKDGRAFSYFDSKNLTFYRGHTPRAVAALERQGYEINWTSTTPPQAEVIEGPTLGEMRNLQPWGVEQMLKNYYGILAFCTRFGKSYMYAAWWAARGRPRTIIFAHTTKICKQVQAELSEWLGEPVGIVARATGIKENWQRLTIACDKSFFDKQGNLFPEHKSYLASTEAIIRDECHNFGSLGAKIYEHTPRLLYSWGCSATPFKNQAEKDLLIEGYCGPLRAVAPAKLLAEYGYVATLQCRWIKHWHRPIIWDNWNVLRDEAIMHNPLRNGTIAEICNWHKGQGLQGIVFVDRVPHGEILESMIPGSVFVSSTTMSNSRSDKVLAEFNDRRIPVIVTTKIWREGVTFFADYAINAEGGRAGHVVVQKAGRPLMPRKDGTVVLWYDILDHGIDKLHEHAKSRWDAMANEGWDQEVIGEK